MPKKKTHEEYVAEVAIKNPNIEVIGEYIDSHTPILHKCKIHNKKWMAAPTNILRGHSCSMCGGNVKKTHEQYLSEVDEINKDIDVLGTYINARTPILHSCKIDGYVWNAIPYVILRGDGCPKCAGNAKKTTNDYIKELFDINSNIEVIGEYIGANIKVLHKCKVDGNEWFATPANTLSGCGCTECQKRNSHNRFVKSHEKYVQDLSIVNPYLEVVGEYINAKTPILHKCKKDGYEWMAIPSNILFGQGCPMCQESKGERKIRQWLEKYNINYIYQKAFDNCKDKRVLPFDFYLPDFNILIEYDGEGHFKPTNFNGIDKEKAEREFEIRQNHDAIKTKYCNDNDIRLLRIPYFKDIEEELNNFIHLI